MSSSLPNNQQPSSPIRPRKRYKLYVEDPTCPIPLRTLERWNKFTRNNDSDEENNELTLSNDNNLSDIDITENESDSNGSSENESTGSSENEDLEGTLTEEIIVNSDIEDSCNHDEEIVNDDNYNQLDLNEAEEHHSSNINHGADRADNNLCNSIINRSNVMLYENSTISLDKAVFDLLNYYVKHNITKAALADALRMQLKILPENNLMPKTVHRLFQYIKKIAPPCTVTKHYFCENCCEYISDNIQILKCSACDTERCKDSFFVEFDICTQIKYLFEHYHLYEKIKPPVVRDDNVITDITDGSEYIRINSRPDRQKYDLTLIINTDGLSLIKSAKSHCWPLLCTIAELPVAARESFVINLGLWYHKECQPSMNTFLRPLHLKLGECFKDGIQWNHPITKEVITSKILPSLIIADAPARAKLQNILSFNGRYGCNICEIRTKKSQIAVSGKRVVD